MGPWFIRSDRFPYMPGCSWRQLAEMAAKGIIDRTTIVRGPTTQQLWSLARNAPGVAHLVGVCHACGGRASADDAACRICRASFGAPLDRDSLGIPEVRGVDDSARAHDDAVPRLSSFASNDELREGLHDEVRRRRSLGSAADSTSAAGKPDPPSTASTRPPKGSNLAMIAVLAGGGVLGAALLVTVLIRAGSAGGNGANGANGANGTIVAANPAPDGATRPADAPGSPADARGDSSRGPRDADSPELARVGTAAPAAASEPQPPALDPAPMPPPEPWQTALDRVNALLRQARDSTQPRQDRSAALDDALSVLDSMAPRSQGHADAQQRIAEAREQVNRERRRLQAEAFVRREGTS